MGGGGEDVLGGERTSRLEAGKVTCDRLRSSIERQNLTPGQGNWVGVWALCSWKLLLILEQRSGLEKREVT